MNKNITGLFLALFGFSLSVMAQDGVLSQQRVIPKKGQVVLMNAKTGVPDRQTVREMPRQGHSDENPLKHRFVFPKKAVVNMSEVKADFAPSLLIREMPRQGKSGQQEAAASEPAQRVQYTRAGSNLAPLTLGQSFMANNWGQSTPNDNDMAVSDSFMVSVINTNVYVRNIITNENLMVKSLFGFTQPINNLADDFDPKVMYDPSEDRFVVVCMVGFVDTTSKIIVAFSQTHNPAGLWNLYELPGDALNNGLWSDYPMIAMTEKELFLTVNLLYNDSSWQTGFVETLVWQMAKDSGYAGKDLNSVLHSNIKHNSRAIRNLCPAKGGSRLYGPNMHFVSNRNLDTQNDTVFLVNITDVIGSPNSSVTVKALQTNLPYRFPPDGVQKSTGELLATNDSRNLGALFENNKIQYVHNTKHVLNNRPTVQHGIIHYVNTADPIVTGYLVENDSLDYAYPNISYAGLDSMDNTCIITFNHSSPDVFPGCSAVQSDGFGEFSPVLKIKDGLNYISVIPFSSLERWGDYSGSQRRYNKPGEVWMSGYYGYYYSSDVPKAHAAWVAQITTDAGMHVGVVEQDNKPAQTNVFPNPAAEMFSVKLSLNQPEYLRFELFDVKGALVVTLMRDWVKTTSNTFSFNTRDLGAGVYLLKITGNKGTTITRKIVVN